MLFRIGRCLAVPCWSGRCPSFTMTFPLRLPRILNEGVERRVNQKDSVWGEAASNVRLFDP